MTEPAAPPDPQHRVQQALAGRYAVDRELGRGGMAIVYLARDLKHGRFVALKVLRPELAAHVGTQRFLREIETAARLSHPHILPLHDSGAADGLFWYVMPYVEGESLRARLSREGPLPLAEAIQLAREVAGALSHAHSHGVVHRDIKPENILCSGGHALVADFGIAHAIEPSGAERITETGIAVGTPLYMSPEQASGARAIDARSDIYSLGCVVYEMLGGQPPFTAPTAQAVLARHTLDPVPALRTLRPTVPVALQEAIERALGKMPADRFATAHEFGEALDAAQRATSARAHGTRQVATGAAVVVLAVAAFLGVRTLWPRSAAPGRVAVLYFDDLSLDSTHTYLAEGLTEDIIARLGGVPRLEVQSRTAVKRFRGNVAAPAEIGRALGVAYLVNGSVQWAGSRVRVRVELARAATGGRVWARTFDGPAGDVLSMQDSIAQAVAEGIIGGLGPTERNALASRATHNAEAYDHYLRGNFYLNRRAGVADGRRALDEYHAALRLDPAFAEAHGRLGLVYGIYANWPWPYPGLTTDSLIARGLSAADRGLALDSTAVDGWLARGFLLIPHPPGDESQIGFRLDPTFFQSVIALVCPVGVPDCSRESVELLAHAARLAPRDAEVWYQYGRALGVRGLAGLGPMAAGDTALRHSLVLDPDRTTTAWLLSLSYARQRRWRDAEAMIDSSMALGRHELRDFALRLHTRLAQGNGSGAQADLDTIAAIVQRQYAGVAAAAAYGVTMRVVVNAWLGDSTTARRGLVELDRRYPAAATDSRLVLLCLAAAHATLGGVERARGLALLDRIPNLRRDALAAPFWDRVPGAAPATSREGFIHVPGGRIWYRIVGTGPGTPLLVIHGSGVPSIYLKPLSALADQRPVVFYEQLGAGRSDRPTDTTLWRLDRYVDELAVVRDSLGLRDVHLYGHSWGTVLAIEYMLRHPAGVRSLTLGGPLLNGMRYMQARDSLLGTMPDSIATPIRRHLRDGTTDAPEFRRAMLVYYQRYFARRQPWSADLDSTAALLNDEPFKRLGPRVIMPYDCTGRLGEITVPTLFIVGDFDEAAPVTRAFYGRVPGAQLVVIPNTGHLPMQDEPDRYVAVVRPFLQRADSISVGAKR